MQRKTKDGAERHGKAALEECPEAANTVSAAPSLTEPTSVARGRRGFIPTTTAMRRIARTIALTLVRLASIFGAGLRGGDTEDFAGYC